MNQYIDASKGPITPSARPEYVYETAARAWAAAREAMDAAQDRLHNAGIEAQRTKDEENAAWFKLEAAAGRDHPPSTPPPTYQR